MAAIGTLAAALWLLVGLAPDARAATLTPNSTVDAVDAVPGDGLCATATPGECTLRAAIMEANATPGADVIQLTAGQTYTISVGFFPEKPGGAHDFRRDLDITDHLTIEGNGATIDANYSDRVLQVHGATVELTDLTVTRGLLKGETGSGAGIHNNAGRLTIINSSVITNQAGWRGGAIYSIGGRLTVRGSTITDNRSDVWGGGIILIGGVTQLVNTTVAGNIAGFSGGGLHLSNGYFGGGSLSVTHSTITDNITPSLAPQIQQVGSSTATLVASIVAGAGTDCVGTFVAGGYNFGSDSSCGLTPHPALGLGVFGDNGGPTMTRLPLAGSPVLDRIPSGTAGCGTGFTAFDQRGQPRPSGPACDAGAVERQPTDP